MVSTPIGSAHSPDLTDKIPVTVTPISQTTPAPLQETNTSFLGNSTTLMQPTLQPGLPYMSNLFPSHTSHSFPILYNGPFPPSSSTTTEVQPVSLYSEYLGNPYNTMSVHNTPAETTVSEADTAHNAVPNPNSGPSDLHQLINSTIDINKNSSHITSSSNVIENNNSTIFFQSSNYFNNVPNSNIMPAGSEILFGVNVQTPNTNMYIDNNERTTSVTDV